MWGAIEMERQHNTHRDLQHRELNDDDDQCDRMEKPMKPPLSSDAWATPGIHRRLQFKS